MTSRSRALRAGFTLVELLAVMAILGLLVGLATPMITKAVARARLTACQANLRQIAMMLKNWADTRNGGNWPRFSGVQFLCVLVKDKEVPDSEMKVFICPSTNDVTSAPDDATNTVGSGLKDFNNLNADCISYAGRDNKAYPIRKDNESEEVIASDDNFSGGVGRPNHKHLTNIVYGDAHVDSVDVANYSAELGDKTDWVPVGPESPHEGLRKLKVD